MEINEMTRKNGFTLIELVVVVMILGILAAVAAPKLLNTSVIAAENGAKQTLSVVRDAIERYAAENAGALPSAPATDLISGGLLRAPFPACPLGANKGDATVATSAADPLTNVAGTDGWVYNTTTGEFISTDATYKSY